MNVGAMATPRSDDKEASTELAPTRSSLIERLRDLDDHDSWQEFFDTYWKLIYCAAVKAGLSDREAEDVVQETIIGVAHHMPEFRYDPKVCSFKGWLMHVTRRRIVDLLRKRRSRPALFNPLPGETATHDAQGQIPDTAAERAFAAIWETEWKENLVDAAMDRVKRAAKPEYYQIFYLRAVKNMPARQISQLLGVSIAKVHVVAHRMTALVRREVKRLRQTSDNGG